MKHYFPLTGSVLSILLLFLLAPATKSSAQTRPKPKANYPYLLYLPTEYSTSKEAFPLVIYLGGSSQRGNDLTKLKSYGIPHYIEQGQHYPFIVASPQCPGDRSWTTENWFDSLYLDLTTNYRIDTTRIYVTGISLGGYGTWQVAMDHPEKFAAIAPLCGGVNDSEMANISRLKQLPIWTFHGTADTIIPISETESVVSQLESHRGNVKFSRLENVGHSIQYLYADTTIFDWLLKHQKKNYLPRK